MVRVSHIYYGNGRFFAMDIASFCESISRERKSTKVRDSFRQRLAQEISSIISELAIDVQFQPYSEKLTDFVQFVTPDPMSLEEAKAPNIFPVLDALRGVAEDVTTRKRDKRKRERYIKIRDRVTGVLALLNIGSAAGYLQLAPLAGPAGPSRWESAGGGQAYRRGVTVRAC